MTANDRTSVGAGSGDWQTPPDLFARLNRTFQFGYDAFASHGNALCRTYSTVEGTWRTTYDQLGHGPEYLPEQIDSLDGLRQDWSGRRVFGNPPYGDPEMACKERCKKKRCVTRGYCIDADVPGIPDFVEKHAKARNDTQVNVALIPDSRDTAWWRSFVRPYAADYPIGRIKFVRPDGTLGHSPPGGIVVAVFFPDWIVRP